MTAEVIAERTFQLGPRMNRHTLWTRSFLLLSFANFLNAVVFLLLMIVMSKVATDRFGVTPAVAGLAASIFIVGSFVLRPVLGKRIHHIGQTRLMYIGASFGLLLTLLYFVADNTWLLLAVRFFHGAAHGTVAVAMGTMIAGVVPRGRYGEGIGYFTLAQTAATAIGPFAGLMLIQHGGFVPIIIACSVSGALTLICLPFIRVQDVTLTEEQAAEAKGFRLRGYMEPKAVPVGLVVALSYLCYSSVSSFLALYSEAIKLTAAASFFYIVYAVAVFFSRPLVGRRFDLKGENSVLYAAIAVFAVGLAILAVAAHAAVLLLAAAVLGLGFGAIQSCGRALTVKVTPLHRAGQATSTFYIFGDTGYGLGPLLVGLLIPVTGYRWMYAIMAGVTLASLALYHLLHGRRARKTERS